MFGDSHAFIYVLRLTILCFITPKVPPIAKYDLQVVTLIKCC